MTNPIKTVKDLEVYNESFSLGMEIYYITRSFPKEERYSLIDQIIRSSRSVTANIRESYAKRNYLKLFQRYLFDALGSAEETRTWLEYSLSCNYIAEDKFNKLDATYDTLSAKIYKLIKNWKNYEK